MADPGDIIGHVVSAVRTCRKPDRPTSCLNWPGPPPALGSPTSCPGCRGDGTYRAEEVAEVEPWGVWLTAEKDGKPWCNHDASEWCAMTPDEHTRHQLWRERPVKNGDTDE